MLFRSQASIGSEAISARPIRACILIFYYGGPSHIDTYDLKPEAASEVRGEFKPISTVVPGLQICEHLPRMAQVMDKVALIRSVHHKASLHDSASIQTLTGRPLEGTDRELFAPLPQFYPSFGSAVAYMNRVAGMKCRLLLCRLCFTMSFRRRVREEVFLEALTIHCLLTSIRSKESIPLNPFACEME